MPAEQNSKQPEDGSSPTNTIKPDDSEVTPPATTIPPTTSQQLTQVAGQMSGFESQPCDGPELPSSYRPSRLHSSALNGGRMHESSSDTHALATAAGNQATWTQRLATNTDIESGHMKDLADRMKEQADRTKDLANEAKAQVRLPRVLPMLRGVLRIPLKTPSTSQSGLI